MTDYDPTSPMLNGPPPQPRVTRNSPPKRVRVNDGSEVHNKDGDVFSAGDECTLEGPLADELELQGHVTFVEVAPKKDWHHHNYKHADDHGVEHDVTQHRARLGQHHHATGQKAKAEDFHNE